MLLISRDTPISIPASEVPVWAANDEVVVEISTFLTAFIVYDASEPSALVPFMPGLTQQFSHYA